MREKIGMDQGWKFHLGDFTEPRNRWAWGKSGSWNQGPESTDYDDSGWREVDVPHDFVIEGTPVPYLVNEFSDKDNVIPEMQTVNNIHTTAGSFEKNTGWYRKHFHIPEEDEGKRIYFIFDGVYRNSRIILNNFFIKEHLSGYTGIVCDITDFVNYGGDNVISVRVDARQAEGWFYEGGGIYRHTYLLKTNDVHIDNVFVKSSVDVDGLAADITVKAEIRNEDMRELRMATSIIDPEGKTVKELTASLSGKEVVQEIKLEKVQLWDVGAPHLYKAVCRLYQQERLVDEYQVDFGIRDIFFDAEEGFFLNKKPVKLKGVCCHQNHGGLGAALPDEIYTYRIGKLKEMGCNAYRTSHYPPSPALLEVCDRLGMLVMDETRLLSSAEEDLGQLEFMVKRDRNHPSVILYSIGNEEAQSQTTSQGGRIAGTMVRHIKALDDTRPVTMGLLMWDLANKRPIEDVAEIAGISEKLDVAGFNYHDHRWEQFHNTYPGQPMVCTEQGTFKSTRGCYRTDAENCHLSIIDKEADSYMKGAQQWHAARPSYMSGLFLWTGFDYYGEPTPYAWPAISSQFGIMDLCGYPKDFYYYYKAWWREEPLVHIFPHWNGTAGERKDVHVFSNCGEVELFVNGKSQGKKTMETDGYLEWDNIIYEPGEICAVGYKNGTAVKKETVQTAGAAAQVKLSVDFKENDIAVIRAEVQDEQGRVVPDGSNELSFLFGDGVTLLGTSNGDPSDHTGVKSSRRKAFHGLAQAVVRFDGKGVVSVKADGLACNELML